MLGQTLINEQKFSWSILGNNKCWLYYDIFIQTSIEECTKNKDPANLWNIFFISYNICMGVYGRKKNKEVYNQILI